MKRALALLFAGAVLALAFVVGHTVEANRARTVRREAARLAESNGMRAADALTTHVCELFDFGIVKAEGRVTKTQHGVVKGNVSFMSPEQARGTSGTPGTNVQNRRS